MVPPAFQRAYDRQLAQWWPEWWPHVFWDKLPEEARQSLDRIYANNDDLYPSRGSETQGETDVATLYKQFITIACRPERQQNNDLPCTLSSRPRPEPEDNTELF
ncbi:hypothetical protein ABIF79_010045 [Bradyrhizobium japonicum]